jgi:hypothetical protein
MIARSRSAINKSDQPAHQPKAVSKQFCVVKVEEARSGVPVIGVDLEGAYGCQRITEHAGFGYMFNAADMAKDAAEHCMINTTIRPAPRWVL